MVMSIFLGKMIPGLPLADLAIKRLARIVHGADIEVEIQTCPESAGLLAIAKGFCQTTADDQMKLKLQFPMDDDLYAYCQSCVEHGT